MSSSAIATKSEFATIVGRHPAFVTRAIAEGKISGDALIGEGRSSRIRVDAALAQLAIKLDLGQQLAQANPIIPLPAQSSIVPPSGAVTVGTVERAAGADTSAPAAADDPLAQERAEQVRLRNANLRAQIERGAREDALSAGALVDATAVARALSRQLQPLMSIFDELPAAIAKPMSEQFGIDYPTALIAVKAATRRHRLAAAERLAATAAGQGVAAPEMAA